MTNALIRHPHFYPDARAEGEARECDGQLAVLFGEIIERDANVLRFAAPFIMLAGALSDAAKVDAQGDEASVIQRARRAKDDLVVHRAAAQRMRVKHERHAACGLARARLFQDGFEPTVRRSDEKIPSRIHKFK